MFDTIETAQAEILRLQQENARLEDELTAKGTELENLNRNLSEARSYNQTLFNQLNQQHSNQAGEKDEEDEEAPTCEDFAKTLKI